MKCANLIYDYHILEKLKFPQPSNLYKITELKMYKKNRKQDNTQRNYSRQALGEGGVKLLVCRYLYMCPLDYAK
jgi:hypothetical protein